MSIRCAARLSPLAARSRTTLRPCRRVAAHVACTAGLVSAPLRRRKQRATTTGVPACTRVARQLRMTTVEPSDSHLAVLRSAGLQQREPRLECLELSGLVVEF